MPTNEMQPIVADPLGDRRARREAHDDAKADQHRERAKAPTVYRPPPTRHQALIDPGEFHPWRPPSDLEFPPTPLAKFQSGEAGDCENPGDDPEANHDRRLLPTQLLEMMVQRGHTKHPPPCHLVARDLDDDGYRLKDKKAADDRKHQLMLRHDADRPERGADRQ